MKSQGDDNRQSCNDAITTSASFCTRQGSKKPKCAQEPKFLLIALAGQQWLQKVTQVDGE